MNYPTEEELADLYAALAACKKQEAESFADFEAHKATGMHYTAVYQLPNMVAHHRCQKELFGEMERVFEALAQRFAPIKLPYPSGHTEESYRRVVHDNRRDHERAQRAAPHKPEIDRLRSILAALPVKDRTDLRTGDFAVYVNSGGLILANIYEVTRETPKRQFAVARDLVNGQIVKLKARSAEATSSGHYHDPATGYKTIDREVAHRLLAMHIAVNGPSKPAVVAAADATGGSDVEGQDARHAQDDRDGLAHVHRLTPHDPANDDADRQKEHLAQDAHLDPGGAPVREPHRDAADHVEQQAAAHPPVLPGTALETVITRQPGADQAQQKKQGSRLVAHAAL